MPDTSIDLALRLGHRGVENIGLHRLAGAVDAVERGGKTLGFDFIVGDQQTQAKIGLADPPARIDARAKRPAEAHGGGRLVDLGGVEQGGQAGTVATGEHFQTGGDEGAVEAVQRHHVTHRGQGHHVEQGPQIGFGASGEEALATQGAMQCHRRHERHTGGTEAAQAGAVVRPVRVHQRRHARHLPLCRVMVEHDAIGQTLQRGEHRGRSGAAIDEDDQCGTLLPQAAQGGRVGAVALAEAVGNVGDDLAAQLPQHTGHDGAAARPIDVVIAEDGNNLAGPHGMGETLGGGVHVDKTGRVGHQGAQGRFEVILHLIHPKTTQCQQTTEQFGRVEALRDGVGDAGFRLTPRPSAPGEAGGHSECQGRCRL